MGTTPIHGIPFADPTDLVRDWPALSEDVAEAVADGLDEAGNAGIGSNVVQTVKTDTFSASVAGGATSADAISATITPTSADAKILVVAQISGSSTTNTVGLNLFIDGSASPYRGDALGDRQRGVGFASSRTDSDVGMGTVVYLHSPETVSAVSYSIRLSHNSGSAQTVYLNRSSSDGDFPARMRGASSITLIEVAP